MPEKYYYCGVLQYFAVRFYCKLAKKNTPLMYSIPVARYRLAPTIINKILNYKETAQSIIVD